MKFRIRFCSEDSVDGIAYRIQRKYFLFWINIKISKECDYHEIWVNYAYSMDRAKLTLDKYIDNIKNKMTYPDKERRRKKKERLENKELNKTIYFVDTNKSKIVNNQNGELSLIDDAGRLSLLQEAEE